MFKGSILCLSAWALGSLAMVTSAQGALLERSDPPFGLRQQSASGSISNGFDSSIVGNDASAGPLDAAAESLLQSAAPQQSESSSGVFSWGLIGLGILPVLLAATRRGAIAG